MRNVRTTTDCPSAVGTSMSGVSASCTRVSYVVTRSAKSGNRK
jgi:hypothetical protein